jgi:ubiquinone/menaquinone biosynthesis C-methylase UbiE
MFNQKNSDQVFGNTFKRYSKKEILEFIKPFKIRFKKNKIELRKYVLNKECVDLGCGNGRGTIFLFDNGAKNVECVDISKVNLKKTKEVVKSFNKIKFIQTNYSASHNLKIRSKSKDFVWCNGVLMHTHNPSRSLSEVNRILKDGGYAYVYVYGVGGLYWNIVDIFRKNFKNTSTQNLIKILNKLGYPNRYIGEYLDDWKVQHLRKYSKRDFELSIKKNGFKIIKYMSRGLNYDTSEKKFLTKDRMYGDGDLRYLIKKNNNQIKETILLNKTSNFIESKEVKKTTQIITKSINKIKKLEKKIAYASKVQFNLRNELNKKKFSLVNFNILLKKLSNSLS